MINNNLLTVLVVDDSRIFRSIVEQSIASIPFIKIGGSVWNGVKAMEYIESNGLPDVITLDVEMPEMDGIETLKRIKNYMKENVVQKKVCILMLSSVTKKGADITMQALELGAYDFLTKPQGDDPKLNMKLIETEIMQRINMFFFKEAEAKRLIAETKIQQPQKQFTKSASGNVDLILIGVSTGGPKALLKIIPELTQITKIPILIVQHMPPTFTASLADMLDKKCEANVVEAKDNMDVEEGNVYVAAGGMHMVVRKKGLAYCLGQNNQPPENGCRPSVDVLFRSASGVNARGLISVVLTGMGNDGSKSLSALKRVGSVVIAQDQETSVVWGMPGSAVGTGCVDFVLPLEQIPGKIKELI